MEGNTGGAQIAMLSYRAFDDETILGVIAHVALGLEPNTTVATTGSLAGFVRLKILRSGQNANVVTQSEQWDRGPESGFAAGTAIPANSLNDSRDVGETWAIVPFSITSSTGSGGIANLVLAPKTKRRLQRGDQLILDINYSNAAASNAIMHWAATGTLTVSN